MKRGVVVFCAAVFGLALLLGLTKDSLAAEKFAYVDLSKIFSDYNKTKDYDKVLSGKEESYNNEREKKVNDLKQFQDKLNVLSEKEKASKQKEFDTKANAFRDYDREKQTDLRKEQDEKMKEILKDIEDTVKKFAEQEGYTFVFNDRVLVYQSKAYDITDKIIALLNKHYKK